MKRRQGEGKAKPKGRGGEGKGREGKREAGKHSCLAC